MSAPVDGEVLRRAVQTTAKRYPYFSVRLRFGEQGFYYEKNDAPIAVLHTAGRIRLASEETNGHIWAVCYDGDEIFIDFFHSGNLFLSVLQSFREERYLNAFLRQLERNGIPYTIAKTAVNNIAAFPMPN